MVNYGHSPQDISHQQKKRIFGRSAEVFPIHCDLNVRVLVQKLQEFLQAPEKTLQTSKRKKNKKN